MTTDDADKALVMVWSWTVAVHSLLAVHFIVGYEPLCAAANIVGGWFWFWQLKRWYSRQAREAESARRSGRR